MRAAGCRSATGAPEVSAGGFPVHPAIAAAISTSVALRTIEGTTTITPCLADEDLRHHAAVFVLQQMAMKNELTLNDRVKKVYQNNDLPGVKSSRRLPRIRNINGIEPLPAPDRSAVDGFD